jgi:hypothetical protein
MYAYQYTKYLQLEKIADDEFLSKLVLNEPQEWRLTYFIGAMHGIKVDIDVSHLASNQYCIAYLEAERPIKSFHLHLRLP